MNAWSSRGLHVVIFWFACALPFASQASTVAADSPTFPIDTRGGVSQAGWADSAAFILNTGIQRGAADSDSPVFVFDTRLRGNVGSGASPAFVLNTIQSQLDGIGITQGPRDVNAKQPYAYNAWASFASGQSMDVSHLASWRVVGAPEGDNQFVRNVLTARSVSQPTTIKIRASFYFSGSGNRESQDYEVTVHPATPPYKVLVSTAVMCVPSASVCALFVPASVDWLA